MARVLVIDDDPLLGRSIARVLRGDNIETAQAASLGEARQELRRHHYALALIDLRLHNENGLDVLRILKDESPTLQAIMMSGIGSIDDAVRALHLGAVDFIEKPWDPQVLRRRVAALLQPGPRNEQSSRRSTDPTAQLHGDSDVMVALRRLISKAGPSAGRVLITGENGTGKELIARALHDASDRRARPFVELNCAAIPHDLIESELFGHEPGAFTGAQAQHRGKFERAHGGTLFLENNTIERVGGERPVVVDVRIIAATNRNLVSRHVRDSHPDHAGPPAICGRTGFSGFRLSRIAISRPKVTKSPKKQNSAERAAQHP